MSGDVKVVEDGAEAPPAVRDSQRPAWLWVIVGFFIGIGLAVVFFVGGSEDAAEVDETAPTPDAEEPVQPADGTTPTTASPPEGVGEVVAGFPDTLIAVTQLAAGNLGYLTWPVEGPPHEDDLPGFFTTRAEFDASGRMLAMGASVPDTARMLLSVGTGQRVQPLASNVTGFAWHDRTAGSLAYSQIVDGEWLLSVVGTSREPELVARGTGIDGSLTAWGDWGFALQDEDEITLLSSEGEIQTRLEGRVLESDVLGRIVVYDGALRLLDVSGTAELLDVDLSGIGEPETAAVSPDGSKLAVVGGGGHLILPLDGGELKYAPVTSGFPQLAWSSDSRFLVSPWIRGVLIIDTESDAQPLAELTRHTITAVTAVPLNDR